MKSTMGIRFFTMALFVIAKKVHIPSVYQWGTFSGQLWYMKYHAVAKKE